MFECFCVVVCCPSKKAMENCFLIRRDNCNVCNGPKVEEVEERTGLGGGFNERENVEYKRHNDDEVM